MQEPAVTYQPTSLLDVLSPRANRWLHEMTRKGSQLPDGVRVVRFGEDDDDGLESSDLGGKSASLSAR
jgi:hypothetical protein